MQQPLEPTWNDDIAALFAQPYWIAPDRRAATGEGWIGCMRGYGVDLSSYASVKQWSPLIYQYLHSREMPLSANPREHWPDAALEMFRAWVNQGWRQTASDPIVRREIIPQPVPDPVPLRLRRDLRSLSQAELDDYRACVDDRLQVGNAAPGAPGQRFFRIHGDWCLHYQEAFLLWHRAYLLQFEQQIGCAVPYWNWYAADASVDGSPSAGLPPAFRDESYVHPGTGERRPNPLRYAAAKGGVSKACAAGMPTPPVDCHFVQRDPVLYTTGEDHRAERTKKIGLTLTYQQQVARALGFTDFSHPQGYPGYPWANIQSFNPPPPDSDYVYRDYNFDGAYEQPHDNYHGWVGPDMADNSYTAYDPVFYSYHANIDRMFEIWLRGHPAATVTGNYPLHPFAGTRAERLEFTDPRRFVYTAIGDLAKDCRALGYDYGDPVDPDLSGPYGHRGGADVGTSPPSGSAPVMRSLATSVQAQPGDELLVCFDGVRCTYDSYAIDVFLDQDDPRPADIDATNPHYVGRLSRIGMGQEDDKGRCIRNGVLRMLDATPAARALGIAPGSRCRLALLVSDLPSGRVLASDEYAALPGFTPRLDWSRSGWVKRRQESAPASASCCHAAGREPSGEARMHAGQ
jgi:Common central domain of tyrosinase